MTKTTPKAPRVWAGMPIDQIPHALSGEETRTLMGLGRTRWYQLVVAKKCPVPTLKTFDGIAPKYSGLYVRRWLAGVENEPRYFKSARKVPA